MFSEKYTLNLSTTFDSPSFLENLNTCLVHMVCENGHKKQNDVECYCLAFVSATVGNMRPHCPPPVTFIFILGRGGIDFSV